MGDQSRSIHFRALFESALQAYEVKTGITLPEHPLTLVLRSRYSIESITTFLQDQIRGFSDFRGNDKVMDLVKSTTSILSTLSTAAAFDWAIGLTFSPEDAIYAGLAVLLAAAKGLETSHDALIDLLESIEHCLRWTEIYTQIPHTPILGEMVVEIFVGLLSTLALVTKELEQGLSTRLLKKRLKERDVEAARQGLDRLTQDEARTTALEILKAVHGLVQNMNASIDDSKPSVHGVSKVFDFPAGDKLQRNSRRNSLSLPNPWENHRVAPELNYEGTSSVWFMDGDVEAKVNDESTQLHEAMWRKDHMDLPPMLVEYSANAMARNKDLPPPPYFAAREKSVAADFPRFPANKHEAGVADRNEDGWTPLHWAVWTRSVDLARSLVKDGADATAKNKDGSTPLHFAVRAKDMDVTRFLVEHGADAAAQDEEGWSPLHWAVRARRIDLARLLVEHGADTTAKTSRGWTPLHIAVWRGREDLVRLLIEYGADTTARYKDGSTPLHLAVSAGRVDLARLLIEYGASAIVKDTDGPAMLREAVWARNVDLARLLVEYGADATVAEKDQSTPLHVAVRRGSVDLTRLLIEYGADATKQDKDGVTPLHLAARNGRKDLARVLVDHGADTMAKDKDGLIPLHLVAAKESGGVDLAHFLVEHGVDATAQDNHGRTPLYFASGAGRKDLAGFLVEHGAEHNHGRLRRIWHCLLGT